MKDVSHSILLFYFIASDYIVYGVFNDCSSEAGTDCTKEFEVFEHSEKARVPRLALRLALN